MLHKVSAPWSYSPAKSATCPRCGKAAHDPDPAKNKTMCPVDKESSYCVNCKTNGHSAAWKGCPRLKLHQKATIESARLGIPVGVTLRKLTTEDPSSMTDLHSRDHSYYLLDASKRPPTPSLILHPVPTSKQTPFFSFAEAVKGGHPQLHPEEPSPAGSRQLATPTQSTEAASRGHRAPAETTSSTETETTAASQRVDSAAVTHAESQLTEMLKEVTSMMSTIKSRVSNLNDTVNNALNKHSKEIDSKLQEFPKSVLSDSLVNSIVDKLGEKRQQQIRELRKKTNVMQSTHPVARLLGQCLVQMVDAIELNQPQTLLETLTLCYNAGHRDNPVYVPVWDEELNTIASLAFGNSEAK